MFLSRRLRNRKVVILPSREPNDFEEPHYHAAGLGERSHDNSWMPGIDLQAILTLHSAEEQTFAIAGPPSAIGRCQIHAARQAGNERSATHTGLQANLVNGK